MRKYCLTALSFCLLAAHAAPSADTAVPQVTVTAGRDPEWAS